MLEWELQAIARRELAQRGFAKAAESPELRAAVIAAARAIAEKIRSKDGTDKQPEASDSLCGQTGRH